MNQKYDSKNRYPFKKIRRLRSEFNNQKQKKSQWRVPHRQQLDSDEHGKNAHSRRVAAYG